MDTTYKYYLNKIKRSAVFRKKEKCYALINYFEHMIQNNKEHMVSEKTIAFDALHKDQSFDPNNDSSVRVLIFRFKKLLTQYYLTEGINDDIVLLLQDGSYAPMFHKCLLDSRTDIFFPRKEKLDEQILLSLSIQYSLTTNEYYLDKIIEFYEQLEKDISSKSPFILATIAEALINKTTIFNSSHKYSMKEIEYLLEKANYLNDSDEQVIFTNIVYFLSTQDSKNVKKQMELMESKSKQQYFLGLAYMANGLIKNDERCIKTLNSLIEEYDFIPAYWCAPNILSSMRKNDNITAMHYAQKLNKYPSLLSKIIITVLKAKTNNLSIDDEKYISKNEYFFSENYLKYCLFDQVNKYSLF